MKIEFGSSRCCVLSFPTTHDPLHRRLLLRFHTAQNSASSGPNPIAGPVLKKWSLPLENLGSVHLMRAMAMEQGPLTALNSCACFNRSNNRLPSAEWQDAEPQESIIFMHRGGLKGHERFVWKSCHHGWWYRCQPTISYYPGHKITLKRIELASFFIDNKIAPVLLRFYHSVFMSYELYFNI